MGARGQIDRIPIPQKNLYMKTIVLTAEDLQIIVKQLGIDTLMDEMIERLTRVFQELDPEGDLTVPRSGFSYSSPNEGLIEWMPAMRNQGQVALKLVGYHPSNTAQHNLPTILSTASAYDTGSGHLVGVMDGTFLTALRTGAASALASGILARGDSSTLGLVGCGAQALTQLHALSRIFTFDQVLLYDIDPTQISAFPQRASCLRISHLEIREAALEDLISNADIVCTTTTVAPGSGPVFGDYETRPWVHINAVGSDFSGKQELPKSLLSQCFVCPDDPDQAINEGECQQLEPSEIGPSLVNIVRHPESYHQVKHQRSVFDSTGWALEDQAAVEMFLYYADQFGLGISVQIESNCRDAKNPYAFLDETQTEAATASD